MTPRTFATLAAVAAVSLATALVVHAVRSPWTTEAASSGKLFPRLGADIGKLARIAITQGGTTLTLEKSGDAWQVASQDGYPADLGKIRALVHALDEAVLLEPKTKVAARYAHLEVDDPASKTSNARLFKLEAADGTVLAEVIAGKQRPGSAVTPGASGGAGTYVRRPGDEQSWLASGTIAGGATLKDWANPRVFETETEKIANLTVEVAGEPAYTIKRSAGSGHELDAIPAGKKIKYVNLVDNIVEAASFLDFERVRKASGSNDGKAGTVTFTTDGKLKIVLDVRREPDGVWVTVDASGDGDAKTAADDIRSRAEGWEFEITPSKADTMLKTEAELLEDIEPETPAQESAQPAPGTPPGLPPGMPMP